MLNLIVGYAKGIKGKIIQQKLLTKKTKQKERVEVERSFLRAAFLFLKFIITIILLGPSPHVQSRAGNPTPLRDENIIAERVLTYRLCMQNQPPEDGPLLQI